ncbi:bifunctional SulP family inorganic anion transporter/carbonic anhydrase [Mycobacterium sp. 29Ha]|uniref:bifunctional SulP family inorganic anion transporter/carbonic anhydrase n=1 Tax=Mycobacterium sp. 29Ha TaxID=2939268 RepID=UPI002938F352|nr:bifunctional SulP family inorganic anion transporter/carbonic anhydrase [Mycobacterium sp. 29Ha]MDV3131933.1 bifunctional SulP family inorganic anion transporter/carbonic anhydrase [Mycobacterium sp. 29Ha]
MPVTSAAVADDDAPADGPRTFRDRLQTVVRYDFPASIVVFLVAVPLSIGIAIASNAPIMAGLIAAVVGGIVAGAVGGAPLLASGPAAGLTVVVAETVNTFGWKTTTAIVVGAGLLQIIFGVSRLARTALAISPIVVHAMLAGIGITIALQQVHVLLGGSSRSTVWDNLIQLPAQLRSPHLSDIFVGVVVIAIMLTWKRTPARLQILPGPLVAIVAATLISFVPTLNADRIELDGSILDAIGLPTLPEGGWVPFVLAALTIALIASVESLLSAVAVDKMHSGPKADLDRELIGQGAANVVSGMVGGLPVTGVIVRSATNVAAGARTQASSILHGVWVLLFSVLLVGLVQQIPKAALAGLLIVIGIQLVKLAHIRLAWRTGDLAVYVITVAGVLFLNLLEGVAIGIAVTLVVVLWRVVRASVHAEPIDEEHHEWRVTLEGTLSFLSLPRLTRVLASIPSGSSVTVELTVDFLDHAAYEAIEEWARRHRLAGGSVCIDEIGETSLTAATAGPPIRRSHGAIARGLLPWRANGHHNHRHTGSTLSPVLDGIARYHRLHAPLLREHLNEMPDGQQPHALFLTCADARLVPNVITGSGPGDLFTVRNLGNLVLPNSTDLSMEAALAYGIIEMNVNTIIICGHSECGAMRALLSEAGGRDDIPAAVAEWIEQALPSLDAFRAGHPVGRVAAEHGYDVCDQLAMVNVARQVENLTGHPVVGPALEEGRLEALGLFLDVASGRVLRITGSDVENLVPAHS